jgi:hypothetical protein
MILTSCIELMAVNVDKTQDLYQWMAQQQDEFQFDDGNLLRRQDSLLGAFGSAWSQDDSRLDLNSSALPDSLFSKSTTSFIAICTKNPSHKNAGTALKSISLRFLDFSFRR